MFQGTPSNMPRRGRGFHQTKHSPLIATFPGFVEWMKDNQNSMVAQGLLQHLNASPAKVNGVKTHIINQTQNIKNGHFNYKPRQRLSKSAYDKTDCSHGIITDKDYIEQQSNIARTSLFTLGLSKSDAGYWAQLHQGMRARRSDGSSSGTGTIGSNYRKLMEVVWQKCEYSISNKNSHAVELHLYDLVAKGTQTTTFTTSVNGVTLLGYDPLAQMQSDLGTVNTAGAGGSFVSLATINDIEFQLGTAQQFRSTWGICKHTYVVLGPGDQYNHHTFHRKHFVFDLLKMTRGGLLNVVNSEVAGIVGGVTTGLLVRAQGRVVNQISTDVPTIDGVNLDTIVKYKTYIREHKPYQDFFALEADSVQWTGEGDPRPTAEAVEEDNPQNTAGFS